jgi:pimeloyl-ACP methyl ester carboxylesterase
MNRYGFSVCLLMLLPLWLPATASAQVIVHGPNGVKLLGERVEPDGDDAYKLEVYRGFSRQIAKTAVQRIEQEPEIVGGPPRALAREPKARLSDDEKNGLDRLIVSYFESAEQPAERAKVLAELRKRDTLPAGDVAAFAKRIRDLAQSGPKLVLGTNKFSHPRFPGVVHVELHPKDQPPHKELPVFLALHGGGEKSGDWSSGTGMFISPARTAWKKGLFICPSVLQQRYAEWGRNPLEEEYVKELLKAAKRTWDIDTNRVYIGGHSMGGYGTWHIGGHQADVFAGLVSAAGGILTGQSVGEAWGWGVIGNLRNTPVTFVHGTKDGPSPVWSDQVANRLLDELEKKQPGHYIHRYVEIPDGDHQAPVGKVSDAVKWVLQYSRDPNPKALTWEPTRSFLKHFHWLRVEKPAMFQRLEARIEGNTIEMTTTRIKNGFSLLLNDQLVDLTKPVTVRINGEEAFRGLVPPSVTALIESIDDKLDEKQVYTARIDF